MKSSAVPLLPWSNYHIYTKIIVTLCDGAILSLTQETPAVPSDKVKVEQETSKITDKEKDTKPLPVPPSLQTPRIQDMVNSEDLQREAEADKENENLSLDKEITGKKDSIKRDEKIDETNHGNNEDIEVSGHGWYCGIQIRPGLTLSNHGNILDHWFVVKVILAHPFPCSHFLHVISFHRG